MFDELDEFVSLLDDRIIDCDAARGLITEELRGTVHVALLLFDLVLDAGQVLATPFRLVLLVPAHPTIWLLTRHLLIVSVH